VRAERYDAIVVGAGQGGGPLAGAFARPGRRTAIVDGMFSHPTLGESLNNLLAMLEPAA
jgi:pyruvate/2-oxoglutarate dehydrogenase complex dihydrolipoamide dehydrogenase (E3) component